MGASSWPGGAAIVRRSGKFRTRLLFLFGSRAERHDTLGLRAPTSRRGSCFFTAPAPFGVTRPILQGSGAKERAGLACFKARRFVSRTGDRVAPGPLTQPPAGFGATFVGDPCNGDRKTTWPERIDDSYLDCLLCACDGDRRRSAIIGPVALTSERAGTRRLPSRCSEILPGRIAEESRRHAEHYGLSTGEPDKDQPCLSERAYEERSITLGMGPKPWVPSSVPRVTDPRFGAWCRMSRTDGPGEASPPRSVRGPRH